MLQMSTLIKTLKDLSIPGVLGVHLGGREIRVISSSNMISSLQRILPELQGHERIELLSDVVSDKKLRSLLCYIQKCRYERLGYKVISSVKKWGINKKVERIGTALKWVVRLKNTYGSVVVGVFEKGEMDEFLKTYYPGGMISSVIYSSNNATKEYYEVHQKG